MARESTFFAPCARGLEPVLAEELRRQGAARVHEARAGVAFAGDLATGYRACLWSRTASRVLLRLAEVPATDADELYRGVRDIAWEEHVRPDGTLAVDFTAARSPITHTGYGALKVKDAIVDRLRDLAGMRPSVDTRSPDMRVNVAARARSAVVSVDMSGEALHRRGYRAPGVQAEAPLKETLAAGVLLLAGWPEIARRGGGFQDPMCGSGTLPLEAALIAADIAPGLLRKRWGFTRWLGHDEGLWEQELQDAEERRARGLSSSAVRIAGSDVDERALRIARECAARAGLEGRVGFAVAPLEEALRVPGPAEGLVAVNPPYGERLSERDELQALYAALGSGLREGRDKWVLAAITPDERLPDGLGGWSPDAVYDAYNGRIPVKVWVFAVGAPRVTRASGRPSRASARGGARSREDVTEVANRVRKRAAHLGKWARRTGVTCYRLYDADLPDFNVAVDLYQGAGPDEGKRWVHVAEYAPPAEIDPERAGQRLEAFLGMLPDVLDPPPDEVFVKRRERQRGSSQYQPLERRGATMIAAELNLLFEVNLSDYIDTGLFLDQRITRQMLRKMAKDKRFLNLFGYTGTATVFAAAGGARETVTVDLSATYLEWAERNMRLNGLEGGVHRHVQADVLQWLDTETAGGIGAWAGRGTVDTSGAEGGPGTERESLPDGQFDLVFLDPPTFSTSKRMQSTLDIQRDHVSLILGTVKLLADEGLLLFSTNRRGFELDGAALERSGLVVRDVTAQTVPKDFERTPRVHSIWEVRRGPRS